MISGNSSFFCEASVDLRHLLQAAYLVSCLRGFGKSAEKGEIERGAHQLVVGFTAVEILARCDRRGRVGDNIS